MTTDFYDVYCNIWFLVAWCLIAGAMIPFPALFELGCKIAIANLIAGLLFLRS